MPLAISICDNLVGISTVGHLIPLTLKYFWDLLNKIIAYDDFDSIQTDFATLAPSSNVTRNLISKPNKKPSM